MLKKFIITLFVSLIVITSASFCKADESETVVLTGVITGTKLHMRVSPSTESAIINSYSSGTKVEVLENDGNWCYVRKGEHAGYMMTKYLTITANYKHLAWAKTRREAKILSLYREPSLASEAICRFFSGAHFELLQEKDNWYKVRFGKSFGYIEANQVEIIKDEGYGIGTFSDNISSNTVHYDTFGFYHKEFGEEMTVSGTVNENEYRFTYPVTGIGCVDAEIKSWMKTQRKALPADSKGTAVMDYETYRADDRYVGVLLYMRYQDETTACETVYGFNIDTVNESIIFGDDLLTDGTRSALILDSKLSAFIQSDYDGYQISPASEWFHNAVLTQDGLAVFLPCGIYLPASIGTQRFMLDWKEISGCISLESDLISAFSIDPNKPMICLTFDDGPHEQTERILDCLKQNGAHASFCVQGRRVSDYESTLKRTVAEGNEIVCHTYSHKKLTELSSSAVEKQLTRVQDEVQKIIPGYQIKWLRCPYGSTNGTVKSVCRKLNMSIAFWQIDTEDWSTLNADSTYRTIMKEAKNGVIVLCHDIYSTTADAMERVIPALIAEGYQLVTLSEMFQFMDGGPVPGTVYTHLPTIE